MRAVLGALLAIVARLLAVTFRVTLGGASATALGGPAVFAFWHGRQMALLGAPRRRGTLVMVSWSKDGELQAGAMRGLGFEVVRGSSSRGGAGALKRIARGLAEGTRDAAFAVDGPRGPAFRAKPGAALAAALSGARLVPVGSAVSRVFRLRSWDGFEIPWPFARVAIVLGRPLEPRAVVDQPELLERALSEAERDARALLDRGSANDRMTAELTTGARTAEIATGAWTERV
jgi:lysophospholipid acyltransferase (LPLAT)-like uncharacterized protein